jgi:DNA topoisomerase-2
MEEKESENFTVLDETGSLKIFESATDIINYFVSFRLKYYDKRKAYLIGKLESDLILLSNRARFIQEIINDTLKVNNVAKSIIEEQLEKKKFDKISDSYTYLLSMAIHTLTKEKFEELLKQVEDKKAELEVIKSKEPAGMYKEDLLELKKAISKTYIL